MGHAHERCDKILDVVVQSYIETAEPVGSRTLSRRSDLGLSPASIRNVMADLEEAGLLMQPHTSAGRVPTDKGYRYWVDALMKPEGLSRDEKEWVLEELSKARTIDAVVEKVSKIIAALTENAAIVYIKSLKRASFLSQLLEDLDEMTNLADALEESAGLFIEGAFRVFDQPEFRDLAKMRHLLQAFDEKDDFLQIFIRDLGREGIHVHIGRENTAGQLEDVSLVLKDCYFDGIPIGGIAVVGPTRMRYPKVVSVVDFVADTVTEQVQKF